MAWPPISQKGLHRKPLRFLDARIARASVFPLFDDKGTVEALMLALPDDGRILVVENRDDLFVRRWFQEARIDVRLADLRASSADDLASLADAWHFDPWWVLGDGRFTDRDAVDLLKGTNVPGFDELWRQVWFDRALTRARHVMHGRGDKQKIESFKPEHLDRARSARSANRGSRASRTAHRAEWRLRPFWHARDAFDR